LASVKNNQIMSEPTTSSAFTEASVPVTNVATSWSAKDVPTVDGALYLAAEVIWPETWPARSNLDLWGTGPDGTYAYRNQADGFFE